MHSAVSAMDARWRERGGEKKRVSYGGTKPEGLREKLLKRATETTTNTQRSETCAPSSSLLPSNSLAACVNMSDRFSVDMMDASFRSSSSAGDPAASPQFAEKIFMGLASVRRSLFDPCSPRSTDMDVAAGASSPSFEDAALAKAKGASPVPGGSGGISQRGGGVVGCEYASVGRHSRPSSDLAPAGAPLSLAPSAQGRAFSSPAPASAKRADWANGLPPDFLETLANRLKDDCRSEDWASVQNVYSAAGVCAKWREAIQRNCFERTAESGKKKKLVTSPSPRKIERRSSLVDRMLCHPSQLVDRRATGEDVIRCYIVREKTRGPFPQRRYKLVLGDDYTKQGKTLLVAHHQLLATKSAYNIYLSSSEPHQTTQRLGQLHSSPYGTVFDLFCDERTQSGSVRRTKSGNIKYTFNMLGGRGPRSVQVNLGEEGEGEARESEDREREWAEGSEGHGSRSEEEDEEDYGRDAAEEPAREEDRQTILENKLPRWHELLQCWCLDFGGRVKCASVKNFQLVSRDDPEEIILQFGKVEADVFTMDFRPKLLSAQQAFMICLSSFDSKLSCF